MAQLDPDNRLFPAVLPDLAHDDVHEVQSRDGGVWGDVIKPGLTVHARVVDEHGDEPRIAVPGHHHCAAPGNECIRHIGDADHPGADEDIDAFSGHFFPDFL